MIVATPATLAAVLLAATPGTVIQLAPGPYPDFTAPVAPAAFAPPVTITACAADGKTNAGAVFHSLTFSNWTGVNLQCIATAAVGSGPPAAAGLALGGVHQFTITNFTADAPVRAGIKIGNSDNIRISYLTVTRSGSDGLDIAGSQNVTVDHLRCSKGAPTSGAHPDCLQLYGGTADAPLPVAHVTVTWSVAEGPTQGFDTFANTGTMTDVHFEHLAASVSYSRGISLTTDCSGCTFRYNGVSLFPGTRTTPTFDGIVQIDPTPTPAGWAAGSVVGNSANSPRPAPTSTHRHHRHHRRH